MTRQRISIASVSEPEDGRVGSQCLKVGEQLYISGQIAFSNGELVGAGDPLEQCRQCFRNIEAYVAEAGGTLDDVVSLNIFLNDIRYREAAIVARSEFFSDPGPGATVVGGVDFAFETLLVEISAIAHISKNCSDCGGC
ncbi:RidA family protein [Roseovarius sp. ZX-A-9]|uniref:RidA family protein n=1 Tax=Roseovarius sp. ZX-A-9 TaxID=3014783 RepID=UPI00232F2F42|nr:RidA family protein [Roseovarius sp. ZX-A-9]